LSGISALPAWAAGKVDLFSPLTSPHLAALFEIAFSGLCFGIVFAVLAGYFIPDTARPFLERAGPLGRRLLKSKTAHAGGDG